MDKKQIIEYVERFGECHLVGVTFDTFKEVNSWMNFLRKRGIDNIYVFSTGKQAGFSFAYIDLMGGRKND